ncbi:tail tubular protein [Vibrio phage Athena1]|nr:tail tubular protein [Vibrio phage Athena1]
MSIQVAGIIEGPLGTPSPGITIRVVSKISYRNTYRLSTEDHVTTTGGAYDFQLNEGFHKILIRYRGASSFTKLGDVSVSDQTPSPITLINLLESSSPKALVVKIQELADDASESAQSASDDADQVALDRQQVTLLAQQVSDDADQVALDKVATAQSEANAAQSATNASQSEANAQQSADDAAAIVPNLQSQIDDRVTYPELTTAQGDVLGGKLFKGSNGEAVENGDVVEPGTTHLRVLVGGKPAIVAMSPASSGGVSSINEKSATIGGVLVALVPNFNNEFTSVQEMKDSPTMIGGKITTTQYHDGTGYGGAEYINRGQGWPVVADGYVNHGSFNGHFLELIYDEKINILKAGAKPGDYSFDNRERILAATKIAGAYVPEGKFYSTPIRPNRDYDNKSITGAGYNSMLSLISSATEAPGVPLLHIPRNGGAYGGAEEGAKNFFVDMVHLHGGDANATYTTTGLVVENSFGFKFGTLWSSGFYKSGMLIDGTCEKFHGGVYYGFSNGNQVGASTGGQGFAISAENSDTPQLHIDYAECWDNGVSNFGQGADFVSGNFTIGTLLTYLNGSSGAKIVNAISVNISKYKSRNNNLHTGQAFGGLYTNGDFGTLTIDDYDSEEAAASGLSLTKSGHIVIGKYKSVGAGGSGITVSPESGKKCSLSVDSADIEQASVTSLTMSGSGDSEVRFGKFKSKESSNQGAVVTNGHLHVDKFESEDNAGTPLFLSAGDDHYVGQFISTSQVENAAIVVGAAVNNACIISARSKGAHTATISDSGTNTYKPNVI